MTLFVLFWSRLILAHRASKAPRSSGSAGVKAAIRIASRSVQCSNSTSRSRSTSSRRTLCGDPSPTTGDPTQGPFKRIAQETDEPPKTHRCSGRSRLPLQGHSRTLAQVTERRPGSRALAWLARMGDDLPELIVEDAAAWAAWLAHRHATSDGVWLALAKRGGHPPTRLRYQGALEEALCYGWIDGQVRRGDADSYRQRFTPRRKRSAWSKRNVDLAERLIGEGRMKPTGKAAVEQARSDGRWQAAYAGSATIEMPDDLAEALAAEPKAAAMFALLTSQNRYAILYRLATAKRSDTRSRRLTKFVEMLARGETIYPQQRRPE